MGPWVTFSAQGGTLSSEAFPLERLRQPEDGRHTGPLLRAFLGNEIVASTLAGLFVPSLPDSWHLPHKQIKPTRDRSGAGFPSPAENDHDTDFSLCIPWWLCQATANRTCPGHANSRHQAGGFLVFCLQQHPTPSPGQPRGKVRACPLDLDLEIEALGRPRLCPTPRLREELSLQVLRRL